MGTLAPSFFRETKDMKKIYTDNDDKIKAELLTTEYFLKEIHSFRKIMCSAAYTLEQKDKALEGLMFVYIGVEGLDLESPEANFFNATLKDWEMRRVFELMKDIKNVINELKEA